MKTFIFCLLMVAFNTHNNKEHIDLKYCKAIHYISSSKDIKKHFKIKPKDNAFYRVSEQVIDVYLPFFNEELTKEGLLSTDRKYLVDTSAVVKRIDENLKKLTTDTNSNLIVFFSEINEKGYLFAELLNDTDVHSDKYQDITQFNTSLVVLFIFDENGNIKKTYMKELNYN